MKKMVAALATGVMIAGAAVTNVSAEEYKVQEGDSLWDIANEYNTTVDDLVEINELKSTTIHPNQKLFINETYKVEKGDTLSGISKKFDVAVDDIKEWNDLTSDLIVAGQKLEIKGVNIVQEEQSTNDATNVSNDDAVESSSNDNESTNENTQKASKTEPAKTVKKDDTPQGKTVTVKATAYTSDCDGCSGVTSTGIDLNANPDAKVIAVDPDLIPLGSEVYVEGYGHATAADVGSAIKGNKIDVHVPNKDDATQWGVRTVDVTILK
ncbi:LysM peptidoglycan-binding domain-containing protein [Virgibacillus dakarensis]|uniref:Cell wall-binding protein YocH n=1 Tax=Lentibacillus populi TaxID=1827502 RepID=A0A9W5TVJ6_9BACI|nr:3D domain-containing protein [Lentibacillus populi]MBT2215209.1 LysM peptidoglycan-binding domain-containing protein [Virgibacillus dakarensis]MTW87519.1 LysM peptidoglycan-binding domain-containing protein [Virgibacillus dakarensis]GGB35480.1 cell wall-binding protein YocH [Lentibacillus populi]